MLSAGDGNKWFIVKKAKYCSMETAGHHKSGTCDPFQKITHTTGTEQRMCQTLFGRMIEDFFGIDRFGVDTQRQSQISLQQRL